MDALVEFLIPIRGLKNDSYNFDFQIDNDFFNHFEDSLIKEGSFKAHLNFEKRSDFYELVFSYEGTVKTNCDRCLAKIDFPIKGNNRLLVKFAEDFQEDVDVIYIPFKTEKLNVAKYIYEYISLAFPYVKIYDCQEEADRPCDEAMLKLLDEEESEEEAKENPLWDQLKNIKFN